MDRVPKISLPQDAGRVEAARDSLEEEQNKPDTEDGGEEEADGFEKTQGKAQLRKLTRKPGQSQTQTLEIPVSDIDQIKFLRVDMTTQPQKLALRIFLADGEEHDNVLLPVSSRLALEFRQKKPTFVEPAQLTTGASLRVELASARHTDEEHTLVSRSKIETTVSKTLRYLVKRTWLNKLGLKDQGKSRWNPEILAVYGIVAAMGVVFYLIYTILWG